MHKHTYFLNKIIKKKKKSLETVGCKPACPKNFLDFNTGPDLRNRTGTCVGDGITMYSLQHPKLDIGRTPLECKYKRNTIPTVEKID